MWVGSKSHNMSPRQPTKRYGDVVRRFTGRLVEDVCRQPRKRPSSLVLYELIDAEVQVVVAQTCDVCADSVQYRHHMFAASESRHHRRTQRVAAKNDDRILFCISFYLWQKLSERRRRNTRSFNQSSESRCSSNGIRFRWFDVIDVAVMKDEHFLRHSTRNFTGVGKKRKNGGFKWSCRRS